jgi:hypothetical protein
VDHSIAVQSLILLFRHETLGSYAICYPEATPFDSGSGKSKNLLRGVLAGEVSDLCNEPATAGQRQRSREYVLFGKGNMAMHSMLD